MTFEGFACADPDVYEELAGAEALLLKARATLQQHQREVQTEMLQALWKDVQQASWKSQAICESSLQSSALAWLHGRVQTLSNVMSDEIMALTSQHGGQPPASKPVQPSRLQRQIIEFPYSLFLQGRSGTGKTVCIIQRILRRQRRFPNARRLFVTRSSLLCTEVCSQNRSLRKNLNKERLPLLWSWQVLQQLKTFCSARRASDLLGSNSNGIACASSYVGFSVRMAMQGKLPSLQRPRRHLGRVASGLAPTD